MKQLRPRHIAGFSLVELMVAITIGLMITAAAIALFVTSKRTYHTTDATSRLQENARFAAHFLTTDLRRSGYFGCPHSPTNINIRLTGGTVTGDPSNPIVSVIGTEGCPPSGNCSASDTLTISYFEPVFGGTTPVVLANDMLNESDSLTLNIANHGLEQNDIVAITDCATADIFQITNDPTASTTLQHAAGSPPTPGNQTNRLSKHYSAQASIMKLAQLTYSIQNVGGRLALFRGGEEVVDGIDNLQFLYGINAITPPGGGTARMPLSYVKASNVGSWSNVVSVRLGLLARTVASTTGGELGGGVNSRTYSVLDATIDPTPVTDDTHIRHVFETTVMTRNSR